MYSNTPSADNLLLGKGSVYFRRVGEANSGYRHLGNVDAFELTTTDDVLEKFSSMTGAATIYKTVNRRRTVELRLTADEFVPDNVAMVLMGEKASSGAQAATAVTGETLTTNALKGGYYRTAKVGPITGVVVRQGVTALVLGTDYTISDPDLGIIHLLPSSSTVTAGETITADYTPTAYAAGLDIVRGGTASSVQGSVLFVGDPASGPKMMVEVWSVSVRPDGAFGLISEDFGQMAMVMAVQEDVANHPQDPMYRITYLP